MGLQWGQAPPQHGQGDHIGHQRGLREDDKRELPAQPHPSGWGLAGVLWPDEPATTDEDATAPITAVEVAKMDANVMMHLRSFDYIHLEPVRHHGEYLDAAFRNVRNLGIVSVTSTDTGSLYSKSPNVTLRHYGCHIVRTEYYKELAARMGGGSL
ncbi:hypothetical protein CRUP_009106 [Coryphaenoides rupestris]|nr:hypothetical protein CRUP_009106 [Coryphaenoides rupestris]